MTYKTVTIYTKPNCPYCERSKALLRLKQVPYEEINIADKDDIREWLKAEGHKTVPQLYVDGKLMVVGGFHGLAELTDQELYNKVK